MGIPARFAVAQRSTAECLGLFAAAQRLFERRGVDFQLVAFETAAERGVEGLTAGEWDYIEIGVIPLVRLRADGHDPAIVVGTTPMNTNFLMGRQVFKTNPDFAKSFLHNHLDFEENVIDSIYEYYRSVFQTRPSLPHIQVAIDDVAKVRPDVSGMTPADLIETRFLDEMDAELH